MITLTFVTHIISVAKAHEMYKLIVYNHDNDIARMEKEYLFILIYLLLFLCFWLRHEIIKFFFLFFSSFAKILASWSWITNVDGVHGEWWAEAKFMWIKNLRWKSIAKLWQITFVQLGFFFLQILRPSDLKLSIE
jgi:hypothetical protein